LALISIPKSKVGINIFAVVFNALFKQFDSLRILLLDVVEHTCIV